MTLALEIRGYSLAALSDIEKERLKLLGDEYKVLAQGIAHRVDLQQKLLNFHLIFLAVLGALVGKNPSFVFEADALPFLVMVPLVLMFFVWAHTNHDAMIIAYAEFINKQLKPTLEALLQGEKVLEFEKFLKEYRKDRYSILTILGGEYNLAILLAIISLLFACALLYQKWPITLSYVGWHGAGYVFISIVLIEMLLLFWTVALRVRIGFSYLNIHNISELIELTSASSRRAKGARG